PSAFEEWWRDAQPSFVALNDAISAGSRTIHGTFIYKMGPCPGSSRACVPSPSAPACTPVMEAEGRFNNAFPSPSPNVNTLNDKLRADFQNFINACVGIGGPTAADSLRDMRNDLIAIRSVCTKPPYATSDPSCLHFPASP